MKSALTHNYMHVCENVIRDARSGSLSFINVRRNFMLEAFPAQLRDFFVAVGLTFEQTAHSAQMQLYSQLKIIAPDNKIILDMQQTVPFQSSTNKQPVVDCVFHIERLVIAESGMYRIQLVDFQNEVILGQSDLHIHFPPNPKISYRSDEEIDALLCREDVIKKVDTAIRCPKCKHEKKFTLKLEQDLLKRLEQEMNFPEDFVYICEGCGAWRMHLGKMMVLMYNKLGQTVPRQP